MSDRQANGLPEVSVIVPAYNAAHYLGDALESLRTQTFADIEVLVVDDGSTDETAAVAKLYAERDARFHLLRQNRASGRPGCARNVGLRAARGTYVAFLDADDISVPTRIDVSLNALRSTGASAAFGDLRKFRHADGSLFERAHLEELRFVERAARHLEPADEGLFRCSTRFASYLLTDIPAINTQTFFARRADLAATGFFEESLVGSEDLDLFLRIVERHPVVYIDSVLTLMRIHETSLTATQTDRCVLDAIGVRRAHLVMLRPNMTADEQQAATSVMAAMLADLGYGRWLRGDGAGARAAFIESLRLRPHRRIVSMYLKAWLPRTIVVRLRRRIAGTPA